MRSAACLLAIVVVALSARPASPAVYRWVDDRGVVHYSDRAPASTDRTESAPPAPAAAARDVPAPPVARDGPAPVREAPARPEVTAPVEAPPVAERPAPAPRPSAARSPRIRELMERMHVAHDLDHMAGRARQAMFEQRFRTRIAPGTWAAVNAAFSPEALGATAADNLSRTLGDSPMLPEILAWLRSPVGRHVMDLAAPADTPAREAALRRFAADLPDNVSLERIRLARELGRSGDFLPLFRDVMRAIDAAIVDLVERSRHRRAPASARAVTEWWTSEHLRWQVQLALLFDFRELSDAQMREAIAFWMSPAGRALSRAYRDAVLAAVATAHDRAAAAGLPAVAPVRALTSAAR